MVNMHGWMNGFRDGEKSLRPWSPEEWVEGLGVNGGKEARWQATASMVSPLNGMVPKEA